MKTKDILKQAIRDFDGTVIVVSHDREFLDGLVEKVYEFGGGKVTECLGGIYEFLEKKRMASLSELELRQKPEPQPEKSSAQPRKTPDTPASSAPAPRLTYAEQREREKTLKRAAKKVEEAEKEVEKREADIAAIEAKIAAGELDDDIYIRHAQAVKDLENAMSMWELAQMEYDGLKQ